MFLKCCPLLCVYSMCVCVCVCVCAHVRVCVCKLECNHHKMFHHDQVWRVGRASQSVWILNVSLLLPLFSSSMIKLHLRQSTRSIYLGLACLSLALHLLLALFCLSVLQTACVLPTSSSSSSSSSSVPRTDTQRHQAISRSSSSSAASSSSSHELPTVPQEEGHHKPNAKTSHPEGRDSPNDDATVKEKKATGVGKVIPRVKGRSKLEVLFEHPLYNLPRLELQDDDWLLRVKTDERARDTGSEEEEGEEAIISDSQW